MAAALDAATSACRDIRDGILDGSIGVPAEPAALAPAVEAAGLAAMTDATWQPLNQAMTQFATDAPDPSAPSAVKNGDLHAINVACEPTGIRMPSA